MDGIIKLICVSENNHKSELLFIIGQFNPVYHASLREEWLQLSRQYWGENKALGRVG